MCLGSVKAFRSQLPRANPFYSDRALPRPKRCADADLPESGFEDTPHPDGATFVCFLFVLFYFFGVFGWHVAL